MSKPDWEAIESAYRAGSLSVRAIGEKHGVNHATILKRANKEGWQRDLTEKAQLHDIYDFIVLFLQHGSSGLKQGMSRQHK